MRSCGDCTKCCGGWLIGEAHGHKFWPGRPCHFISSKGCTIYEDRPDDPCKIYNCLWLENDEIPEWFKPNISNVIISQREKDGIYYWDIAEAGSKITVEALTWLFQHCLSKKINFQYRISGGVYKFGVNDFLNLKTY